MMDSDEMLANYSPLGSSFDEFLAEENLTENVDDQAIKQVIAWQLEQARLESGLSKSELARAMATSRPQLDRVLDPENVAVSLDVLARAAAALGKRLRISVE